MTNKELKILNDANLADNTTKAITPVKLRAVTDEFVDANGSWADYVNSSTTNQSISAGVWTELTNDKSASNTDETYIANYATTLFSSNRIDLSDIPVGVIVTVRIALLINILSNNSEIDVRMRFRNNVGTDIFNQIIDHKSFKTTGELEYVDMYIFFIGTAIVGGTVALEVNPDSNAEALFKGITITIP